MRYLVIAVLSLTMTGCGVAYHPSAVRPGVSQQAKVRIEPITANSLMAANAAPYTPRRLPAAFNRTAGLGAGSIAAISPPNAALERPARPETPTRHLPPPLPSRPYKIGVGDVVLLATPASSPTADPASAGAARTSRRGYRVQDDGTISIPNVGRIAIAGLTVGDAEARVFKSFLDTQIDPAFSLEIAEFNARKVTIGGAVGAPSVVPVTLQPLYLDAALAAVGGTGAVDPASASVRLYRDGTLYQVPLSDVYQNRSAARLQLAPGDSLFVDAGFDLDRAEAYFRQQITLAQFKQSERGARLDALSQAVALRRAELTEARETFATRLTLGAEARDYVYLTGEVRTPARYPLPFEQTASLADALYDAGGGIPVARANPKEIYVLRGSDHPMEYDAVTAWHLDARNAAALVLATRFELRPGDVIFVAAQPVANWSNVIDGLTPSLLNSSLRAATN
ncbi:sugar transporter [Thioclava sp. BHET1]|nr:sugar transporter [Thioclava sp. BHET1]